MVLSEYLCGSYGSTFQLTYWSKLSEYLTEKSEDQLQNTPDPDKTQEERFHFIAPIKDNDLTMEEEAVVENQKRNSASAAVAAEPAPVVPKEASECMHYFSTF